MIRIKQMENKKGQPIANQFLIFRDNGVFFQSYNSLIAYIGNNGEIYLDNDNWDYSKTTAKYRNRFLNMTTREIKKLIKEGKIILTDLENLFVKKEV